MDCKSCTEDLTAYLDGELNRTRFQEVEGHLEGCLPCLEELESLKRSVRLVESNLPELDPKPELWNHLTARIAAARKAEGRSGWLSFFQAHQGLTAAWAVAASIVLAMGIWGFWNHQQSERALRQYMSQYIQQRDSHVHSTRARASKPVSETQTADADHVESADNPFVEVNAEPFDNPFRSEAQ